MPAEPTRAPFKTLLTEVDDPVVNASVVPGEVFISYARQDEARVSRLVQALERHGLVVWWDRGVVAGENWRARIQTHLDFAAAVVVVWTKHSVGDGGRFVRDEASHAQRRGKTVAVRLDRVEPPPGLDDGAVRIDLPHWARGLMVRLSGGRLGASHRDPFVLDLVAALRATMAGQPMPRPRARRSRLIRRLAWGAALSAAAVLGGVFAGNLFQVQELACELDWAQPELSDACGAWGLGRRPTRDERLAWAARPHGTPQACAALRDFVQRFPAGHYAAQATALLAARKVDVTQRWTPAERALPLRESARAGPDRDAAEQAALDVARVSAERQCKGLEGAGLLRARQTDIEARQWDCRPDGKQAWACTVDGLTTCRVELGQEVRAERCD
jgi:hypothetical protein